MTNGKRFLFVGLSCLLAGLLPGRVHATVVLPATFTELVSEARVIAHGRVTDVRSEWAAGRRRIDSLVTIDVDRYFKGDLGDRMTIKVPGGALGRYRSVIVGAPVLSVNEEVVLFVGTRGPSWPHILGLGQGVFRVVVDPGSGRKLVTPPPLAMDVDGSGRVVRGDPSRTRLPLEEFSVRVERLLGSPARRAGGR